MREVFKILLIFLFSITGKNIMSFNLKDYLERVYKLEDFCGENAKFKMNAIIVSFFTLNCKECMNTEIPALKRIYNELKSQKVFIFLIGFGEDRWKVGDYFSQNPTGFPVLIDPQKKIGFEWGIHAVPNTFIIDKNCRKRFHLQGSRTDYEEFIKKKVLEIIGER